MQINVALVRQKSTDELSRETWTTLFGREYVRRTLIGIMIMFFQREYHQVSSSYIACESVPKHELCYRVERH